jgi:hypothetical protein
LGGTIVTLFVVTTLVLQVCLEQIDVHASLGMGLPLENSIGWKQGLLHRVMARNYNNKKQQQQQQTTNEIEASVRKLRNNKLTQTKRELFEEHFPPHDMDRIKQVVEDLRVPYPAVPEDDLRYDIYNCPNDPPKGYPLHWKLTDMLHAWNPDNTEIPTRIYNSLCVFNYETDLVKINTYRQAEVPFVVLQHPDILRTTERWSNKDYLSQLVGTTPQRNEYSHTNHFMFWRTTRRNNNNLMVAPHSNDPQEQLPKKQWEPPTTMVQLTFDEWMQRAQALQEQGSTATVDKDHWYFRLNAVPDTLNDYLYDELPIFQTKNNEPSLFMVDPSEQRGLNCRFGMKGVIAESHFDPTRNWIVVLGGQRRYILSHPRECQNLQLFPLNHPSGRHSAVDWSHVPDYGPITQAMAHEVVLQAGDALYLPTSWFHFIVSLNINYQCNARSGYTTENHHYLHECGFPVT